VVGAWTKFNAAPADASPFIQYMLV
jgi:hypothetical protein